MKNQSVETTSRRILRIRDVEVRIGFKRSHIYKLLNENKFPPPTRIGIRAIGWDSRDIDAWVDERLKKEN